MSFVLVVSSVCEDCRVFFCDWCDVSVCYDVQFFADPDQFLVVMEDGVFVFQLLFCVDCSVVWCDSDPWFLGSVGESGVCGVVPTASVSVRCLWSGSGRYGMRRMRRVLYPVKSDSGLCFLRPGTGRCR